jgi:hypothetical protein
MDRTVLLASYPDLVAELQDEAANTERERVTQLLALGDACDAPQIARRGVQHGWTVAQAMPRLREAAGRNESTARAFFAACETVGVATGETSAQRAARLSTHGQAGSTSAGANLRSGDLVDLFASDLGSAAAGGMAAGSRKPASARGDLVDLFAADLPRGEPGDLGEQIVSRLEAAQGTRANP